MSGLCAFFMLVSFNVSHLWRPSSPSWMTEILMSKDGEVGSQQIGFDASEFIGRRFSTSAPAGLTSFHVNGESCQWQRSYSDLILLVCVAFGHWLVDNGCLINALFLAPVIFILLYLPWKMAKEVDPAFLRIFAVINTTSTPDWRSARNSYHPSSRRFNRHRNSRRSLQESQFWNDIG